jgi:dihydroxyacetone kinase-like protein
MKKLMNNPAEVVTESLQGFASAHSELVKIHFDPTYVIRADAPIAGKVALLSGGGSGHEPMHSGFVGRGMLDAACPGHIFTSPTPDQMFEAVQAVNGGSGVLFIVKNYTGDVLNFEMAAELCSAEGIDVTTVITNDDVAVENSLYTAGRRGVGITVFIEKIAGAAAERRMSLQQVADICRRVNDQGRSMGMALTSCAVPSAGKPTFEITEQEMEIGIGIHGEPGRIRMGMKSAKEIMELLADSIFSDLQLCRGKKVIAMVNGMGGTPLVELYLMYHELQKYCATRGISIVRSLVGNYITSLEMAGCSVTLLRTDDVLTGLWDDPVLTPAMRWGV